MATMRIGSAKFKLGHYRKPGMIFTIEFFHIRLNDDAHATLDRLSVIVALPIGGLVKPRTLKQKARAFTRWRERQRKQPLL
jgi:hypothetical protein